MLISQANKFFILKANTISFLLVEAADSETYSSKQKQYFWLDFLTLLILPYHNRVYSYNNLFPLKQNSWRSFFCEFLNAGKIPDGMITLIYKIGRAKFASVHATRPMWTIKFLKY